MSSAEEWKAKGNAAFTGKLFGEAVSCFTRAIELSPSDHVLFSNRSGAYASMGRYDLALEDASKCISLKPDWAKGFSRKGLAQFQLGDMKGAIATFKKGLAIDPENAALKEALRQAEEKDPEMLIAKQVKMMTQVLLNTPPFKKYCQEDPTFSERLKGILQEVLKDPKNLQIAMSICPDPRIKEALSIILGLPKEEVDEEEEKEKKRREFRAKQEAEAAARREKAEAERQLTPEEAEGEKWKEEGNKLYKAKSFSDALEAYGKAIAANPKEVSYYTNRAAVYLEMGDFEQCLKECNDVIDSRYQLKADYEKIARVYTRMAACYKRMGDLESCISCYEKSLLEDNNRHTRTALADVRRLKEKKDKEAYLDPKLAEEHRLKGNDFFKKGEFPEAKKEYDEAIRRDPADPKLYANRAAALIKLLCLPDALKDVEKALELDATVAKVWARKGTIHFLLKEYNKAMNAYQKGLEIDSSSTECQQGLQQVISKVQEQTYSDTVDEQQVRSSMEDPEIQAALSDPQFRITLARIQEDPSRLVEALKDPTVAKNIQKLMAAGILKVS